ncbi:MAG: TlpA disulfide reductase family protein [Phycisphaeraceae bacterium]
MIKRLMQGQVSAMLSAVLAASLLAAPRDAKPTAAEQLAKDVLKTYQTAPTYHAKVTFSQRSVQGRWEQEARTWYSLAIDRAAGRLLFDHPDFVIVCDGTKLRVRDRRSDRYHMEVDAPKLQYDELVKAVPVIDQVTLPALLMALSDDPWARMSGVADAKAVEVPGDASAFALAQRGAGQWRLTVDPQTRLLKTATLIISGAMTGGPSDESRISYEYQTLAQGTKLGDELFAFDTSNSQPVGSLQALGAAVQKQLADSDPMEGKAAPALHLPTVDGKDFDLSDEKADVIVLDFWASWCGPCKVGMPQLQKAFDDAKKEGKSVAVYTINVGESAEIAKQTLKEINVTLPTLVDADTSVAVSYRATHSIPRTVFIVNGKVARVHTGTLPTGMDQVYKATIDELLKTVKKDEKAEAKGQVQGGAPPAPR